jgi:hypothetical protein
MSDCLILLLILALLCSCKLGKPDGYISFQEKSPNGCYSVQVRELENYPDRNFQLILINHTNNEKNVIYTSPDEGNKGSERIYWSTNNDYILLTGRQFFMDPKMNHATNKMGEQLYLLYSIASKELRCNSSQGNINRKKFTAEDIEKIVFSRKKGRN